MPKFRTVGEVARKFRIPPRVLSDLFYGLHLDSERCPIVGNRRLIPDDYVGEIEAVLRDRGLVESEACAAH